MLTLPLKYIQYLIFPHQLYNITTVQGAIISSLYYCIILLFYFSILTFISSF